MRFDLFRVEDAANPSLSLAQALMYLKACPDALARNPALPLWALEDPGRFVRFHRALRVWTKALALRFENLMGDEDVDAELMQGGHSRRDLQNHPWQDRLEASIDLETEPADHNKLNFHDDVAVNDLGNQRDGGGWCWYNSVNFGVGEGDCRGLREI